ncbi:peptide-methionine (R)-S-oxide reductase MsrB [Halobellus clavatus]|jgi:peptide-methionine (R)-S-oxide reductase|uniref:peptide-methionine (R)-S-oxide reductase n=1 Tax=Halobellus clavatus TaxID=660517 RepID=A0A1H3F5J2_9EURY|nr:peptide-methionine (R)-S-oxide reductase MsrB [Halobellus clavatus]SDX86241.1 peptide-methionine (R)-S-oxide reductase [Halobellus clavatus]
MAHEPTTESDDELPDSEEGWRDRLTEEEYEILRERGTEPKFSGDYLDQKDDGSYRCAGCQAELFDSETKYDSGSGWPAFFDAAEGAIETETDTRHGMRRVEVLCRNCGGHLGHVFEDGPDPTGKRYCINSAALEFDPEE